jgi:hypothetical protein
MGKSSDDKPHIKYLHMGPWPGFVGLCFNERDFRKEMKRLDVQQEVDFLSGEHANAALHHFVSKAGVCQILTLGPVKGRSKEQVAGLIAHEAVHVIQNMQDDIAGGKSLGGEAEAYLVQMIVQEALQILWKSGNARRTVPVN